MSATIQVHVRNVYGAALIYPWNREAEILATMIGKKTFNATDLRNAAALGLAIECVSAVGLDANYNVKEN